MSKSTTNIAPRLPSQDPSERLRSILFLLVAVIIWGLQPVVIRMVLNYYSVFFTAFVRSLVAAALFGSLTLSGRNTAPVAASDAKPPRTGLWVLIGGLGLGISTVAWNVSMLHTTVGATCVLQLIGSVLIAFYGIFFLSEGCDFTRGMSLFISLCGMFLISWNGQDITALVSSRYFYGNMVALLAGVAWSFSALGQKMAGRGRSSVAVVAPMFALSTLIAGLPALFSPVLKQPFNPLMLALMLVTGILGMGVGNYLFARSMRTIPASVAGAAVTANPLIALVAASLFLHEPATLYMLIGAPLTTAGVAGAFLTLRSGVGCQVSGVRRETKPET